MSERRQLQELALVVHTALACGHALGILYNAKKKNWKDTLIHVLAFGYDTHAALKHLKATRDA